MIEINSIEDLKLLRETVELECKLAAGRDGKGQLPDDFWPTYSAFANNKGGIVLLGVRERNGRFELGGVADPDKLRLDLFNQLNNRQKVSANLLNDSHVRTVPLEGQILMVVEIPAASRKEKPVHLNGNPMTGTYRRLNDGDRQCDPETIRRMLAEQIGDSRDDRLLKGYNLSDLSSASVRTYRQVMRDRSPEHPYLDQADEEFLRLIGAWRRDRETGETGLTVAGLLMFGRSESIRDEFPNYFLDYQERAQAKTEARWIDRLTLDGTWPGNLFEFYRRTYRKLVADLKIPFSLQNGQRQDETPVHVALREALVNCIVHADYTGRVSILVVKRPDMFGFRNPGLMRIPVARAIAGGESDGRNRILQQMFLLIGAGERAGSGVPKIHKGWVDQHWRPPALYERDEPSEQTLLELRMVDLVPAETMEQLRDLFGATLDTLSPDERLILAAAATERTVTHARISTICDQHPTDITRMFQGLVQQGLLVQTGRGRGATYHLPGTTLLSPEAVFGPPALIDEGSELEIQGSDLKTQAPNLSSEPYEGGRGRKVDGLSYLLIDTLEGLDSTLFTDLKVIASRTAGSGKVAQELMRNIIQELCAERFLTIKVLSKLLNRDEDYLRQRLLNPMVEDGTLARAFPQTPNDPRQAYTSSTPT